MTSTDHEFANRYAENETPWDIGHVQPAIAQYRDLVKGKVLDAGCGTGDAALFFAGRDLLVTGVDGEPAAIEAARAKAEQKNLPAEFIVHDALDLGSLPGTYDTVVDCLLFHVFDDEERVRYVSGLRQTLRPGGTLLLLTFSDQEPPGEGPRRVSAFDLAKSFARGFVCKDLHAVPIEIREQDRGMFSPSGPKGWLAQFERLDDGVLDADRQRATTDPANE